MDKPVILCASGNSIPLLNSQYYRTSCGLSLKLEQIIKGNYSIGLNYWFKYGCDTTFNSSGDWQFYIDNYKALKNLPMIVASREAQLQNRRRSIIHENTILLKSSGTYNGIDSIKKGVFSKQLIGIWALSLAISLGFKEIYLLGYDCCEVNGQTHFFQGVVNLKQATPIYIHGKLKNKREHYKGVGKKKNGKYNTSTYDIKKHLNDKWFAPFHAERKKIKIYNVSPDSVLNTFEKIDYETFYKMIKNNHIDQNEARDNIRRIINEKNNA